MWKHNNDLKCLVLLVVCVFVRSGLGGIVSGVGVNHTLTLGFILPWERELLYGPTVGSAIVLGIEEVERRQILPGYTIEWSWRDSWCHPQRGMRMAVDIWDSVDDLDGIIGGACSIVCQPVSLLAASWGIPVVSWACTSDSLSDKTTYPTFTRTEGTWTIMGPVIRDLAKLFGWNKFAVIYTQEDIMKLTAEAIGRTLEQNGKTVLYHVIAGVMRGNRVDQEANRVEIELLESLKVKARIYVVMLYPSEFLQFMYNVKQVGMLNGEYAFIGQLDMILDPPDPIFSGVLGIGARRPSSLEYKEFLQNVIDTFQYPIFDDWSHVGPDADINEIHNYAGFLHDAVLQWAYGVNKTLEQGGAPDDGLSITANIINMTFQGITGTVQINQLGDRNPDQRVDIVQTGSVMTILEWFASDSSFKKIFKAEDPDEWSGILWPGNSSTIPSDAPLCGWQGELCADDKQDNMVLITALLLTSLFAALSVVVLLTMKHIKKNQYELIISTVKVCNEDLMTVVTQTDLNVGERLSQGEEGHRSGEGLITQPMLYKGEMVVIKKFDSKVINVSDQKVLRDLKVMRDIVHENIIDFIGICTDGPNAGIVTSYATRGSLQEVIINEDVKLNWDFKVSIIADIICGLNYIHQSALSSHGHLSSAKCLLDRKWVCKLSGHGLQHIRKIGEDNGNRGGCKRKLLWTAPELLRERSSYYGTKEGDIFSFAIIMQEIVLEGEPYFLNDALVPDIVEKVKRGKDLIRPIITQDSCPEDWRIIIQECWSEHPQERPTCSKILQHISKITKGKDIDILERMLRRLESYTNNLETSVQERTREIQAEKDKTEMILSELLPQSATKLLMEGKAANPEMFENVTLFFSDIVGFTRISASLSPMQVVAMLNTMYTVFDDAAHNFDVYKVATIGDAYMIASGAPIRNGDRHGVEVCKMALSLLDCVDSACIPGPKDGKIKMRCGIHSGPCVGGVIGLKTPRYLFFGHTVDIASRMESSGDSMKIHISQTTYKLIQDVDNIIATPRESFVIKLFDRIMCTYWISATDI